MRLTVIILSCFILVSCSHFQHAYEAVSNKLTDREARANEARNRITGFIQKHDYENALRLAISEKAKQKSDTTFDDLFIRALDGLAGQGKALYEQADYFNAGVTFHKVADYMSAYHLSNPETAFAQEEAHAFIKECSMKLQKEGINEYRKGNLGNAIYIWEDILKFDAGNTEVEKAIKTARIQLQNLKKIEEHEFSD